MSKPTVLPTVFSRLWSGNKLLLTVKTFRRWRATKPGLLGLLRRGTGEWWGGISQSIKWCCLGPHALLINQESSRSRPRRRRESSGNWEEREQSRSSIRITTLVSSKYWKYWHFFFQSSFYFSNVIFGDQCVIPSVYFIMLISCDRIDRTSQQGIWSTFMWKNVK